MSGILIIIGLFVLIVIEGAIWIVTDGGMVIVCFVNVAAREESWLW